MAGVGSRFAAAGYSQPKPLILVHGVPMIQVVINNLRPACEHRFIFICQESHVAKHGLRDKFNAWAPGSLIVEINGLTDGAACTVLAARSLIDDDEPLMIANTDQYVDVDMQQYLHQFQTHDLDGLIMTMSADDPKWSFVGFDDLGWVNRVVEKQVISHEATVGVYNFRRGCEFVAAAEAMIAGNERVNGEFYVAPAYNSMIRAGKRIGAYNIGSEGDGMHGLGIPADLELFLAHPLSQKIS